MHHPLKSLQKVDLKGKSVLLRVDYNVPMDGTTIRDTTRLDESIPTIHYLLKQGARVTLISHRGRPKSPDPALSLAPLIPYLEKELGRKVTFNTPSPVTLYENLRFHAEEEANDPAFAASLAKGHDLFVNDAFSVCHRAHASTVGVTHYLPSFAGLALHHELTTLESFFTNDSHPLMALIGGAKISTKIGILKALLSRCHTLAIGGAMANTFLSAQGHQVGTSLVELSAHQVALDLYAAAKKKGVRVLLPVDLVVAQTPTAPHHICDLNAVPADHMILDCGPKTVAIITAALADIKTVVWNGPFGLFETPPFDQGTQAIASAISEATQKGHLQSLIGGGDTLAAVGHTHTFTATCTAGGAFLDWLSGNEMPGLTPLLV